MGMRRHVRIVWPLAGAVAALLALPGAAGAQEPPPSVGGGFTSEPCTFDGDEHERKLYEIEGWEPPEYERYPGACERLRFAYGPLTVKPGQNDVLIEPITIQSPRR